MLPALGPMSHTKPQHNSYVDGRLYAFASMPLADHSERRSDLSMGLEVSALSASPDGLSSNEELHTNSRCWLTYGAGSFQTARSRRGVMRGRRASHEGSRINPYSSANASKNPSSRRRHFTFIISAYSYGSLVEACGMNPLTYHSTTSKSDTKRLYCYDVIQLSQ